MEKMLVLFVLLSVASLIRGQCSEDTCMQQCIPNQWERDLCLFYQELSAWRSAAVQCDLDVDPIPQIRPSSPDLQWEQAREYWEHLRAVWQEAATENGVFGTPEDTPSPPPLTPTTPPPPLSSSTVTTEKLVPFPMEEEEDEDASGSTPMISSRSGSGMLLEPTTDIPTDPPTEEPATTAPPSPIPQTRQELWLDGVRSWEEDFAQWESFTRSESGLRLPVSTSGEIVGRLVPESGPSNERANSVTWFELLSDWNEGFTIYNTTFSGVCPQSSI